jgi:NAD(P)-dependent dehydrogenase (short-subunit alcohol dehydrogenase family)
MEVKKEQLEYEFAVNVFGVIYMTQAVVGVRKMPKGGRIINIGSIASKLLVPPPVYGAAKAAADALTTLWAGEVSFLCCSSTLYARQLSNEMPESLVRAVELPSIHSHPVQFQQICRKTI